MNEAVFFTDHDEEGWSLDSRKTFQVNAFNGEEAYWLAVDRAGNFVFEGGQESDSDEALLGVEDHPLAKCETLGGYEICVLRRSYCRPGGSEYESDYAVVSMHGPHSLYDKPDIEDESPRFRAACEAQTLLDQTHPTAVRPAKPRL